MASRGRPIRLTQEQRRILGAAIRAAREEMGLTQEELADMLGVRANQPSRWERGHVTPQPHTVARISHRAGWPLARFYPWMDVTDLAKLSQQSGLEIDAAPSAQRLTRPGGSQEELLDRLVEAALSIQQTSLVLVSAAEGYRRARRQGQ